MLEKVSPNPIVTGFAPLGPISEAKTVSSKLPTAESGIHPSRNKLNRLNDKVEEIGRINSRVRTTEQEGIMKLRALACKRNVIRLQDICQPYEGSNRDYSLLPKIKMILES